MKYLLLKIINIYRVNYILDFSVYMVGTTYLENTSIEYQLNHIDGCVYSSHNGYVLYS